MKRQDTAQRHAFIDATLDELTWLLEQPEADSALGSPVAKYLERNLGNLVVANISDGEVRIPANASDSKDAVPVVAVRPGDRFKIGTDFIGFTSSQSRNLTEGLGYLGVSDVHELEGDLLSQFRALGGSGQELNFLSVGAAQVTSLSLYSMLSANESHNHRASLMRLRQKPILALMMHAGNEFLESDVLAHELTHVEQRMKRPMDMFASQEEADMKALRDELEAYRAGAAAHNLLGELDPESFDSSNMQIIVEALRREFGEGTMLDPLKPTPGLLARFRSMGMAHILHEQFRYDDIITQLNGNDSGA